MSIARRIVVLWALAIAAAVVVAGTGGVAAGRELDDAGRALAQATGQAATVCAGSAGTEAATASAAGAELRHAGLVVVFDDGRTETRCVEFAEESISGAELLERSGLEVVFSGFGGLGSAVCRIDGVGCSDPGDCFCQCRGADCAYWSYWGFRDGAWRIFGVGPSQRDVRDGDVDGWVWGSGRVGPGDSLGAVCPATSELRPTAAPPATEPGSEDPGNNTDGRPVRRSTPDEQSASGSDGPPALTTPLPDGEQTPVGDAREDRVTPQARDERSFEADEDNRSGESDAEATATGESSGGAPAALIAFGVVAGLLAVAVGGLALRRRMRG